MNLARTIYENPGKSTTECLNLLVDKLQTIQYSLKEAMRHPDVLQSKIVTACMTVPACHLAVSEASIDLGDLISKLHSSIMSYEAKHSSQYEHPTVDSHFTDRKFHNSRPPNERRSLLPSSSSSSANALRPLRLPYRQHDHTQPRAKAKCWVCEKEGCRS